MKRLFCLFLAAVTMASNIPKNTETSGLSLCGEDELALLCGEPYIEEGYQALDKDGRDISDKVEVTGDLCVWRPGEYELTYSVTDSGGERYVAARKIQVIANSLPETVKSEKTIYLTFDDGPGEFTDELLTLLDSFDAKAAFFLIGKHIERYPEILDRIISSGHSVGIHCYNHDYRYLYASEENFMEDLLKARKLIFDLSGYTANILRFPGGSTTAAAYTKNNIDGGIDALSDILGNMGMRYYDWDESADAKEDGPIYSVGRVKNAVEKLGSPVVIEHDTRRGCLEVTREILEWGTENGYSFKALDVSDPEVHISY